jgi:hypothetical protein
MVTKNIWILRGVERIKGKNKTQGINLGEINSLESELSETFTSVDIGF